MRNRIVHVLIAVLIGIYSGVSSASAQDATAEATLDFSLISAPEIEVREVPVEVEATAEPDGGVTINIESPAPTPTPEPEATSDGSVTLNVWQVVMGVVTLLLSGGFVGGAGMILLVRAIRNDTALVTAIEGLVNSRPEPQRNLVYKIGEGLKEVAELAIEATDGVPVATKGATVVSAPAGSTTVISPPTPFADPRPAPTITTPGGAPLYTAPTAADAERIARERQQAGAVAVDAGYDENSEAVG